MSFRERESRKTELYERLVMKHDYTDYKNWRQKKKNNDELYKLYVSKIIRHLQLEIGFSSSKEGYCRSMQDPAQSHR